MRFRKNAQEIGEGMTRHTMLTVLLGAALVLALCSVAPAGELEDDIELDDAGRLAGSVTNVGATTSDSVSIEVLVISSDDGSTLWSETYSPGDLTPGESFTVNEFVGADVQGEKAYTMVRAGEEVTEEEFQELWEDRPGAKDKEPKAMDAGRTGDDGALQSGQGPADGAGASRDQELILREDEQGVLILTD
jgi:hypothetical protein